MTEPLLQKLATLALEEWMNIKKAEHKTDIALLAEGMAKRDSRLPPTNERKAV